ncbi:MAG: Fic family protein [Candidatus Melainabacteria bacterium]
MPIQAHSLTITPEILQLIADLDSFKGAWRVLKNLAPDRLAALRRVATIESVGSSTRIEGVKLTDKEVESLLSRLNTQAFRSRDEEEVAGYAEVMEQVFESWENIPLTENHIRQLNAMLLRHSTKDERHRGTYKSLSNNVEAFGPDGESLGVVFETASPFDTSRLMGELVSWTREAMADKILHPLLVIALFIVVFLKIHPFQDGNGRLSRILTTLLLLQAGYGYVPYCSLESIVEASKDSYYLALRRTQGTLDDEMPDWQPWVLFFLRSMHKQKTRLEAKMDQEALLTRSLPALAVNILELAKARGRIKTADIQTLTGESRSTIKARLSDLVAGGQLVRHGQGRSTWYTLG